MEYKFVWNDSKLQLSRIILLKCVNIEKASIKTKPEETNSKIISRDKYSSCFRYIKNACKMFYIDGFI